MFAALSDSLPACSICNFRESHRSQVSLWENPKWILNSLTKMSWYKCSETSGFLSFCTGWCAILWRRFSSCHFGWMEWWGVWERIVSSHGPADLPGQTGAENGCIHTSVLILRASMFGLHSNMTPGQIPLPIPCLVRLPQNPQIHSICSLLPYHFVGHLSFPSLASHPIIEFTTNTYTDLHI